MTIAIAWTRTINSCEELIFVTDSRLSGDGRTFDACPKVLTLPRTDCAIAFAGTTGDAYAMMQQLAQAIEAHAPLKRRSMDLVALSSHVLKVFNSMATMIKSSEFVSKPTSTTPEVEFLFGGYSWVSKEFMIWSIKYDKGQRKFAVEPAKWAIYNSAARKVVLSRGAKKLGGRLGMIAFAGDQSVAAKTMLLQRLTEHASANTRKFNWEPFEVVRDMLRDPKHSETIGGSPQVVKVSSLTMLTLVAAWPPAAGDPGSRPN